MLCLLCREKSMQQTYKALCSEVGRLHSELKHQTGLIRKLRPLISETRQGEAHLQKCEWAQDCATVGIWIQIIPCLMSVSVCVIINCAPLRPFHPTWAPVQWGVSFIALMHCRVGHHPNEPPKSNHKKCIQSLHVFTLKIIDIYIIPFRNQVILFVCFIWHFLKYLSCSYHISFFPNIYIFYLSFCIWSALHLIQPQCVFHSFPHAIILAKQSPPPIEGPKKEKLKPYIVVVRHICTHMQFLPKPLKKAYNLLKKRGQMMKD